MGRKPTVNLHLPPGMRARRRGDVIYYYLEVAPVPGGPKRPEKSLGTDYGKALKQWADQTQTTTPGAVVNFRQAAERYLREVVPTKAEATQRDNRREMAKLLEFFGDAGAALDKIEPQHIRRYLDWRGAEAKTRANREKALFSHVFNCAREWGYTAAPNPCRGVKGHKLQARDVYVTDAQLKAVWQAASDGLRDALDLAYLTGQRPADVLKMAETDIQDGVLLIRQNKTATKLRIAIEGELKDVLARIRTRKAGSSVRHMALVIHNGQPMSASTLRSQFEIAREAAGQGWQFRDLRAKAATDKEERQGMQAAQDQLGHTSATMTKVYVRNRKGKLVGPTR